MTYLTGRMLAKLLSSAANGLGRHVGDEELPRAIDVQEMLSQAADMARRHGDKPVDIDITIGPSEES